MGCRHFEDPVAWPVLHHLGLVFRWDGFVMQAADVEFRNAFPGRAEVDGRVLRQDRLGAEAGERRADVRVADGHVAEVADSLTPGDGNRVIVASGLIVCPGFVPQDTWGTSSDASMTTSVSNVAPSSVVSPRQSATAASHASPVGAIGRPSM